MSYNVGDIVRIKSLYWYKTNKDKNGAVYCGDIPFINSMSKYCGKEMTIARIVEFNTITYEMSEDIHGFDWNDDMIECLVKPAPNNKYSNPTWEHVNNAFEAGKKWERTTIAGEVRTWLKYNTDWFDEYDSEGRNLNYGKGEELINLILGKE